MFRSGLSVLKIVYGVGKNYLFCRWQFCIDRVDLQSFSPNFRLFLCAMFCIERSIKEELLPFFRTVSSVAFAFLYSYLGLVLESFITRRACQKVKI